MTAWCMEASGQAQRRGNAHCAVEAGAHGSRPELGGGCQLPVGVWARPEGHRFVIEAGVVAVDGSESIRVRRSGLQRDAEDLARQVAAALLKHGAAPKPVTASPCQERLYVDASTRDTPVVSDQGRPRLRVGAW